MELAHLARRLAASLGVALTLAAVPLAAPAQAREERLGDYVLRSSVLRSAMLPDTTASEHGIDRAPNRAVLNIVVLRGEESVRAEVTVTAVDLNGRPRPIDVRPVVANDGVSYLGVFEFLPREVLDFRIAARPSDGGPPLELGYRERMWFY